MDLRNLLRGRPRGQQASDARAAPVRAGGAAAVKLADDGEFMAALWMIEESISELAVLGRRDHLAEALVFRSRLLDDALARDHHLEEYAAYKGLGPVLSVDRRRSIDESRLDTDRLLIALHSVAGYLDAVKLYRDAGDKTNRAATEELLETAMVRVCAFRKCDDERLLWREFRKRYPRLRWHPPSDVDFLEAGIDAAMSAYEIAYGLAHQAAR